MALYPTTPVQYGQNSNDVKLLQQFLISQGYPISAGATGYFGDQTKTALAQWQQANGITPNTPGFGTNWGPISVSAAQKHQGDPKAEIQQKIDVLKQQVKNAQDAGLSPEQEIPTSVLNKGVKSDPNQPLTDEEYEAGVVNNPINAARITKGNTSEALQYAANTGDLSQLVDEFGQPFSLEAQQEALKQGMEDNRLFYEAQQANDQATAESKVAQKQADFKDYLLSSGEKFAEDKSALDQNATDTGMLFSTSRKQKEQRLQKSYEQEQASKKETYGRDIGDVAQDFQYKYGNDAANGLSQYYNLGSNTYNPNVATGGVGVGGLSSIYDPNKYKFQGTQKVAQKANANVRAAGYLANKGNKLLSTSYNNQF